VISHEEDRFWISDIESTSGTFVDGMAIDESDLKDGSVIQIGKVRIQVQIKTKPQQIVPFSGLDDVQEEAERLVAQMFGDYRVDNILAMGAKSVVYDAFNIKTGLVSALKIVFPSELIEDTEQRRFVDFFKKAVDIVHPNLVEFYGAGKRHDLLWVAMERIDGYNLRQMVRNKGAVGMLNWQLTFRVALEIAAALAELNQHKLVHRNISPSNILVRKVDRSCVLSDLLYAQIFDRRQTFQIPELVKELGDLRYAAPETISGGNVDIRSDIYSLGAVCYATMAGRPMFKADNLAGLVKKIQTERPAPPRNFQMSIPELFQDVILKMVEKRPDERFQTPEELYDRLSKIEKVIGYKGRTSDSK
jgi:serine/threonine-protein kinase